MNLSDTCPIKLETSVKDVIVIKTSGTHSDIRALIHGELPTLSLTFRVVIILTSEIGTKLLEDNFGQTPVSLLCCPSKPLSIDPVDPRSGKTRPQVFLRTTVDTGP